MKFVLASLLTIALVPQTSSVVFAETYSTSQCQTWFATNDRNGDGSLGVGENGAKFHDRITLANDDNENYVMSRKFFIAECKIGSFGRPQV